MVAAVAWGPSVGRPAFGGVVPRVGVPGLRPIPPRAVFGGPLLCSRRGTIDKAQPIDKACLTYRPEVNFASTSPAMANCREPTSEELTAIISLESVFTWSGLQGNVHHAGSAPGSLVRLLGVNPIPGGEIPGISNREHFDIGIVLKRFQGENISTLESSPNDFKLKTFRPCNRSQTISWRKHIDFGIVPKRFHSENIPTLRSFPNDFKAE